MGIGVGGKAKGLHHMGVGCSVLTETELTDHSYPKIISGYHMIASKAASPHPDSIAVQWRAKHQDFEVELVNIASLNNMMFQLIKGGDAVCPLTTLRKSTMRRGER
jgi:hypothetical protein